MHSRLSTGLLWRSVAWILYCLAVIKMLSAIGSLRILEIPDPLLGVSNRSALVGVALVEFFVAGVVTGHHSDRVRALVLFWLSSMFVIYRVFSWLLDPGKPCACLGFVGSWLGLPQSVITCIALGINVYFLTVALAILMREAVVRREHFVCDDNPVVKPC
jgi:hypothetical protein